MTGDPLRRKYLAGDRECGVMIALAFACAALDDPNRRHSGDELHEVLDALDELWRVAARRLADRNERARGLDGDAGAHGEGVRRVSAEATADAVDQEVVR